MQKEILRTLIKFNTITKNSNLALIDFCEKKFISLGYKTKLIQRGNKANLFAYKNCSESRIIFSAHTDTVPESNNWSFYPFNLVEKNKKYYGLGVCDMKIFIAIMFDLAKIKKNNLAFLLTFDEETDFSGAKIVNLAMIRKKDTVIIGEPTANKIITGNKGVLAYKITINGVAGHGSSPNNGVSAIEKAALFILELKNKFSSIKQNLNTTFSYPKPSMNIGTICGGSAINMIADKVEMKFEFRITSLEQKKSIKKMIAKILLENKIDNDLEILIDLEPYITNEKLLKKFEKTGLEIAPGAAYCTEANIFKNLTNNIIVFGPGDPKMAHKENESIEIAKIKEYEKKLNMILLDKHEFLQKNYNTLK